MELYKKYRPQTLEDMFGNDGSIKALTAAFSSGSAPQAYLFYGPTGCGKTTLGRIVAGMLGAVGGDFREVDSADFRGIDSVREIRKQSQYLALCGKRKVWLLDECHKLTNDAQNAILKALEDPPENVAYILCTTDPQKLIKPIRGRCTQYQVSPLGEKDLFGLLRRVVKAEGASLNRELYGQIATSSEGLPRNALQILGQVLVVPEDERAEIAKRTADTQAEGIELCRALLGNKGWKAVSVILSGLREKEEDPEGIRRLVCAYCQSTLLKGASNPMLGYILEEFIEPFYTTPWPQLTYACYSVMCGDKE